MKRNLLRLFKEILANEADPELRASVRKMIRTVKRMDESKGYADLIFNMKRQLFRINDRRLRSRMRILIQNLEEITAELPSWSSSEEEEEAKFTDDSEEDHPEYKVQRITGMRISRQDERWYRVQWEGYDNSDDDTWEPMERLIEDGCGEFIAQFHSKVRKMV